MAIKHFVKEGEESLKDVTKDCCISEAISDIRR